LLLFQFRSEGGADGGFSIREIREIRGSLPLFAAGRATLLYRKVAHFWQNSSASVFSVCSCSRSLVAACRAVLLAPFRGYLIVFYPSDSSVE
jgi:hypothetical protein